MSVFTLSHREGVRVPAAGVQLRMYAHHHRRSLLITEVSASATAELHQANERASVSSERASVSSERFAVTGR
jgi:hypothetical protein